LNLISNQASLKGEIICPGDKSISQRILILGSLLNCDLMVDGFLDAYDPNSTLNALNKIGASILKKDKKIFLCKRKNPFINPIEELDLGNSGTGARLMLGLLSGLGLNAKLVGDSSLSDRPMLRVVDPLKEMGVSIETNDGKLPIKTLGGKIINCFEYRMPIASAQVKSCLILAAASSNREIKIFEPKITRNHTERMIEYFGGDIKYGDPINPGAIILKKTNLESRNTYSVVGDFSSASFIIVATLIATNSNVTIKNVGLNKTRSGLIEILLSMGAAIKISNKKIQCNEEVGDIHVSSSELKGVNVPETIIPNIIDEIPILSVAAIFAEGTTIIKNASELKVKESDRLNAITDGLSKLKISHQLFDDGLSIQGCGGEIDTSEAINSFDDHRIAMSFLVAGVRSKNGIIVSDCKNIETSFPNFTMLMNNLGMSINEKN
tara:strand:- start:19141 stop:20451 length:1311 start_codon:yes stop_codon:yes gene_type:complete